MSVNIFGQEVSSYNADRASEHTTNRLLDQATQERAENVSFYQIL